MTDRPSTFYRLFLAFLRFSQRRRGRASGSSEGMAVSSATMLRALRKVTGRPSFPVALSSLQIRAWSELLVPGGAGVRPARLYRPRGRVEGLILFLHGGGFVHCDLVSHHGICCRLARQAHAMVLSVDYRLAPEHPFPAALEDAWAALCWLAEVGALYGLPVAVSGDSAGGNLSAGLARMARDAGAPEVAAQLLYYPALTGALAPDTRTRYAEGYMLTQGVMEWYARQYLRDEAQLSDERFAPALAENVGGVAPAMIVTAELDPLRGEGEIYRDRLRAAGVPVVYRVFPGSIHGFLNFYALTADGRRAIRQGAVFLHYCFRAVRARRRAEGQG